MLCAVKTCGRKRSTTDDLSYHRFPINQKMRKLWFIAVDVESDDPRVVNNSARVCGLHFKASDYWMAGSKKKLRKETVPSVAVPNPPVITDVKMQQEDKENQTSIHHSIGDVVGVNSSHLRALREKNSTVSSEINALNEKILQQERTIKILQEENAYLKDRNLTLQQTVVPKVLFDISNFAKSDGKILFYTGVQTYQIFCIIFKFVLPTENLDDLNIYNATPEKQRRHSFRLSAENQFFLVLMKLRQNFCHNTLADMFGISVSSVSSIFKCWINLMYFRLGSLRIWPHRNVILQNAPEEYQKQYPNVIGSIDCTEFAIDTPSSLLIQSQCYSSYKGYSTLKSLVMTDPNGAILYCSSLFTGSISDKQICVDSGFVEAVSKKVEKGSLNPGDIIMADKGFNVSALFTDISINIPVFRVNGQQFSAEDVAECRTIAKERIHVERGIGRLKSFKLLSGHIPASLFGSIEQIYTVCCLLCNFRYTLRKRNDNFVP